MDFAILIIVLLSSLVFCLAFLISRNFCEPGEREDNLDARVGREPGKRTLANGERWFSAGSWSGRMKIYDGNGKMVYEGVEQRRVLVSLHLDGRVTFEDKGYSGVPNVGYLGFDTGSNYEVKVDINDYDRRSTYPYNSEPTFNYPFRVPWSEDPRNSSMNYLRFYVRLITFPHISSTRERHFHVSYAYGQTTVRSAPGYAHEAEYREYGRGDLTLTIMQNGYISVTNVRSSSVNRVTGIRNHTGNEFYFRLDNGPVQSGEFLRNATFDLLHIVTYSGPVAAGKKLYNGYWGMEDIPVNKLLWIESHNAHTYATEKDSIKKFYHSSDCTFDINNSKNTANQNMPLNAQLELGARWFKIPVAICGESTNASHGSCIVDGTNVPLSSIFVDLDVFASKRRTTGEETLFVVSLDMQTGKTYEENRHIVRKVLEEARILARCVDEYSPLQGSNIAAPLQNSGRPWPSLREFAQAGKSFIVFLSAPSAIDGSAPISEWPYIFKTRWDAKSVDALMNEDMTIYHPGSDYWNNRHFESNLAWFIISQAITPEGYAAGCAGYAALLNSRASLSQRRDAFLRETGFAPTAFGLDFLQMPFVESLEFAREQNGGRYR